MGDFFTLGWANFSHLGGRIFRVNFVWAIFSHLKNSGRFSHILLRKTRICTEVRFLALGLENHNYWNCHSSFFSTGGFRSLRHGVGTPTREPRPDLPFWLVVSSSVTNDSLARCWPVHPRSTDAISCFQGPRTAFYFFLLTCAHLFFLFLPPARCFHQVSFSTFSVPDPFFRTRLHETS